MNPSEEFLDSIIDSEFVPLWTQDDVKKAMRQAVDIATDNEREVLFDKCASVIRIILNSPVAQQTGTIKTALEQTARQWEKSAADLRQRVKVR